MTKEVSPDMLRKLLRYDRTSGRLFWRARPVEMFSDGGYSAERKCKSWNSRHAHKPADNAMTEMGYRTVSINRRLLRAHRVAWAIERGSWPSQLIDHRNRKRDDNRWINLREATFSENSRNTSPVRGGSSRYLGVCFCRKSKKWKSQIMSKGRVLHLGHFDNEWDAAAAYNAAAIQYHGEFANQNTRNSTDGLMA